jgi:hypothetical protein
MHVASRFRIKKLCDPPAETTLWSSFYALSLSFAMLPSQRLTKTLERSSLPLLQKLPIFRYWYLTRYDEPGHTTHIILLSSASSAIWYVFHISPALLHEFVGVAKFRFYTKKSIFWNLYLRKFTTNWYDFWFIYERRQSPLKWHISSLRNLSTSFRKKLQKIDFLTIFWS